MSRLNLDFSLQTAEERQKFITQYLKEITFKPNRQELNQIGDYLLWGKDSQTNTAVAKDANIQLTSRKGTWDKKEQSTSLEQLIEVPSFNQNILSPFYASITQKPKKEKFSRAEARRNAPPELQSSFEELWHQIDLTELTLNFYDINSGKREKDPRTSLINSLTPKELTQCRERALTLTPQDYLKLRHYLVDLRRQQYSLRDLYLKPVQSMEVPSPKLYMDDTLVFEADINVRPLGLRQYHPEIFTLTPNPNDFTEEQLKEIFTFYWTKERPAEQTYYEFDFRELEPVYHLILYYRQLEFLGEESNIHLLLDTLNFYIEQSQLTEIQRLILRRKQDHIKNQEIAQEVNSKFGMSYSPNYISTIFRHRIIKQINETAQYHLELIGQLAFPENFKRCSTCGKTLLLHKHNFIRKARSADGFTARCKVCDKEVKQRRKNNG